jgi:hypothetical protein
MDSALGHPKMVCEFGDPSTVDFLESHKNSNSDFGRLDRVFSRVLSSHIQY